jgi:hypothetical protein
MMMTRTSVTPLGPYPQFRLYGHAGIAPSRIKINTIRRIVINMTLSFRYPPRIGGTPVRRAHAPMIDS